MAHDLHKDESQCVNEKFLEHVIKTDHLYCRLNYKSIIIKTFKKEECTVAAIKTNTNKAV